MANYQWLLDQEYPRSNHFEVVGAVGFDNLSGLTPIRELEVADSRLALEASADYIYEHLYLDEDATSGEILLYSWKHDAWFAHRFVFADTVSVVPVTDTVE